MTVGKKLFPDGHLIDVNSNMARRKNIKYDSRHRRRSRSECLGEVIDTTIVKSRMPILLPATPIETVVVNLRAVIDELDRNFASAKVSY